MPGRFDPDPPATVADVNARLMQLDAALGSSQPELERLLRESATVDLAYRLRYAAVVKASEARSEDRRRAEAELAMERETLPDSPINLAVRKTVLEVEIKAMREAQHNLRAQISSIQSVAANLRAEMSLMGVRT